MTAQADADWGGNNVHVTIREGSLEVTVSISPEVAELLVVQLGWARGEVERFGSWMAGNNQASRFPGKPKPGSVGGSDDR